MNQQILHSIRTVKQQILPNDRVLLFGSQARGDARPDSDWDLLVLLNKPQKEWEDFDRYSSPFAEIGWDYGTYISVKMYTIQDWEKRKISPFYKNVEREKIEL